VNRYIQFEVADDQYFWRSVCGQDHLTTEFAESVPYFDFSGESVDAKALKHCILDNWSNA
jgi:hypothetical protein